MLTDREKQVYKLKKEGKLQNEIAKRLKISQPAVSNFYNNAIKKINAAKEIIDFTKDVERGGTD
jgi:DNA-binding CsgD family transcriptional regulator